MNSTAAKMPEFVSVHSGEVVPFQLRLLSEATNGQMTSSNDETRIAYVTELRVGEQRWLLRKPLKVLVESTGGGVCVHSSLLLIGGAGSTLDEAVADLADSALRLWLEFRDEPSDNLHVSAQEARDQLSRIFE